MKLPISHAFEASPARVFAAITDPAVLQRCIDGCERMEKTSEDSYTIHLKVGLAGMKGSYGGRVQITEKQPSQSLTLALEGKGPPGFVKATAQLKFAAAGDRTDLSGEADATVGGLIAAVGSRLIEAVAKKMMAEFFARLGVEITGPRAS
jgi:carbon monoxide dehydrogenase subunit G